MAVVVTGPRGTSASTLPSAEIFCSVALPLHFTFVWKNRCETTVARVYLPPAYQLIGT